jgi:uncharacterized protein (TIGR03083 family)
MAVSVRDRRGAMRAIDDAAERLITLISRAPDLTTRVPSTPQWTVIDAFTHVVTVAPRYCQGARHEGHWVDRADELPEFNAHQLAALASRDVATLSAQLRSTLAELAELIDGFGDAQPTFRFHGGEQVAADVALGILLGELIVHGWDIAHALGRPWSIQPSHVELIVQGLTPMLPGWLSPDRAPGHTGTYEVRLRGQGTHRFSFRDGILTMNPPGAWRPDVIISADPVTFLLVCAYKRRSQWPAILTGKLVAWGRKPWLAMPFAGRFHQP